MKTLGSRIINLRETHNLKQQDLARKIGVTKATMSKYENNINIPNADILKLLAETLDTSADYLLGCSDSPAPYNSNWIYLNAEDRELIHLILSMSHDDKIRIAERALMLLEQHDLPKQKTAPLP